AVVGRRRARRVEEERQVDAGRDEQQEAVEGNLAEQERPVIGEDIPQRLADERSGAAAPVERPDDRADHVFAFRIRTPHHDGPTGPENVPPARSRPARSTSNGNCGSARPAGPKSTLPPSAGSKVE